MAFTDLDEELEALGYQAGVFDTWLTEKTAGTTRQRTTQPGYSYREVPTFAKRTDAVSTAEVATWRFLMPPEMRSEIKMPSRRGEMERRAAKLPDRIARRAEIEKARADRRTARRGYHYAHNVASMARRNAAEPKKKHENFTTTVY